MTLLVTILAAAWFSHACVSLCDSKVTDEVREEIVDLVDLPADLDWLYGVMVAFVVFARPVLFAARLVRRAM